MPEEQFTLALFWKQWKRFQDQIAATLAPLTAEQLTMRAAPNLRTVGDIAAHSIASRAWWLHAFLGEGPTDLEPMIHWDDTNAPIRSAAELLSGLDLTWQTILSGLTRWTDADLQENLPITGDDGTASNLSRSYVLWHMLQHDLLHGGELALTLGANGMSVSYM